MRGFVKRPIERAFSSSAVAWMTQRRVRGKRLILAYHGIIPDGERPAGERALFVSQRDFATQLDALVTDADVAPLDRLDEPGDGRPRVSITFDDAYAGAVTAGVSELAKRGLPATIFVVPARLDGHISGGTRFRIEGTASTRSCATTPSGSWPDAMSAFAHGQRVPRCRHLAHCPPMPGRQRARSSTPRWRYPEYQWGRTHGRTPISLRCVTLISSRRYDSPATGCAPNSGTRRSTGSPTLTGSIPEKCTERSKPRRTPARSALMAAGICPVRFRRSRGRASASVRGLA